MKICQLLVVLLMTLAFVSSTPSYESKFGNDLKKHFQTKKTGDLIITLKDHLNIKKLFQGKSLSSDEKAEKLVHELIKFSMKSQLHLLSKEVLSKNLKFQVLWIINGLIVKNVDYQFALKMASRDDILSVRVDKPYKIDEIEESSKKLVVTQGDLSKNQVTIEYNVAWVKAPEVWAKGYTGKGIIVGVGDTGLNFRHEAIIDAYNGNLGNGEFNHTYNWYDPRGSKIPVDRNGHGTHCSGTVAGGKNVNRKIGVAPDARLTHCNALASLASQITCMQWFLAPTDLDNRNPDPLRRPHIISQSYNNWGCSPRCDEDYVRATSALVEAGVAVVNSAGNRGSRCSSINPNARFPGQLSIGSLRQNSNIVSSFSSRGPNPLNSTLLKPDVSGPGERVVSAGRGTNNYVSMSGTSMSTPNIAGGVALLWSAVPSLVRNIEATNEILYQSSLQQTSNNCQPRGTPNGDYGHGTVNYEKAIEIAFERFGKK